MTLSPTDLPEPFSATFEVPGLPIAQGSTKSFLNPKTNKVVTMSTASGLKPWRQTITILSMRYRPRQPLTGAVAIRLAFRFPVQKSAPKSRRLPMIQRPDSDKILRAVLDALTSVYYLDDSQVTDLTVTKRRAYDAPAGVTITVVETDGLS